MESEWKELMKITEKGLSASPESLGMANIFRGHYIRSMYGGSFSIDLAHKVTDCDKGGNNIFGDI